MALYPVCFVAFRLCFNTIMIYLSKKKKRKNCNCDKILINFMLVNGQIISCFIIHTLVCVTIKRKIHHKIAIFIYIFLFL